MWGSFIKAVISFPHLAQGAETILNMSHMPDIMNPVINPAAHTDPHRDCCQAIQRILLGREQQEAENRIRRFVQRAGTIGTPSNRLKQYRVAE